VTRTIPLLLLEAAAACAGPGIPRSTAPTPLGWRTLVGCYRSGDGGYFALDSVAPGRRWDLGSGVPGAKRVRTSAALKEPAHLWESAWHVASPNHVELKDGQPAVRIRRGVHRPGRQPGGPKPRAAGRRAAPPAVSRTELRALVRAPRALLRAAWPAEPAS